MHPWGDRVIYRLLGELEIGPDGRLLDLPGGSALIVLAVLLANPNQRISKTELIRAAWGTEDVEEAQLYKRLATVRALLKEIGRAGDLKTHARVGYEMRVAEGDIDTLRFGRLVREAAEAGAQNRTEDEAGRLRAALGLWRGPRPLANVPCEALYQEAVSLERRRKRAAARLFDLELARGRHEEILGELLVVAGYYPADGRLCEQLMICQYRCGHTADAVQAYERHRVAVEEELGAEPDAALRDLYFAIGSGDEAAIAAAEAVVVKRAGALARPDVSVPHQLPRAGDLIGREPLAAEVGWLLGRPPGAAAPVVVISGPGGIGKTALALRAAHESAGLYPDGQLYAELGGTGGGPAGIYEVLAQFLRALGSPQIPESQAERLAEYRTLLSARRVLVVLDDAVDGGQVRELVPANPGCAVVVTARRRLPDIGGAHHVAPLEPLEREDATRLFLRVVAEAGISLAGEQDAVATVVGLCGGLPLALRIAGALRVHGHPRPTAELAERLARRGPEAFVYGEYSVAAAIGAGFERLDAGARRLFLGFGLLHLTGFGLWTSAALLGAVDAADAAAALAQLSASFMIQPVEPDLRYRFHDLTREYARRRALAAYPGDRAAVPARAYRALLTLVRRAHSTLYGGDFEVVHSEVPDWDAPAEVLAEVDEAPLDWFEKERLNIRAAVGHCAALGLTGICWDLAVSSTEFYTIRSYHDDWYATHTAALAACQRAGDQRGEGIVLACLHQPALAASRRASDLTGVADLERAVDLLAGCGERHGLAIALRTLANALRRRGHLTRPLALFTQALALYEESGDTVGRWLTLRYIGQTHLDMAGHEEARRVLAQAQAVASGLGSPRLVAQTRYWTGQACLAAGDLDGAQAAFESVCAGYGDDVGTGHAYALHGLGNVAWRRGDCEAAGRHFTTAVELAQAGADVVLEGRVWLSVAALRESQGSPGDQVAALRDAVAVLTGCGAPYYEARALAAQAQALASRGEPAAAAEARLRLENLFTAAGLPEEDRHIHRLDL
jgi:DNA-binding SARP family transcriptional activator/tetratricopeptide (TPR) repeat protein